MKYLSLFLMVLVTTCLQAQWVQSNLNCNIGRSLYSDGTTVFAASSQGVYSTSGSGDPWFSIGPASKDIFCVTSTGSRVIAGSAASDGVFISTNSGQTWYQPPTFSNQSVRALAKGSAYVFAGTWGGGVWRSSDGGESWEPAGLNGKAVTEVYVTGSTVFAGVPDAYSKVYSSTDNGNSWSVSSLGYPASNFRSLFFDGATLFACDFGLWASTDMGKTWNLRYGIVFDSTGYPTSEKLFRKILKWNNLLVASVDFESIYTSADGGYHWTPFNEGIISDWTFVDLTINGSNLWGLRDFFGNAYRRPLGDLATGLSTNAPFVRDVRLDQNFPNPFNPSTTISYALPNRSHVALTVVNSLGQQAAVLQNGEQDPGNHEVTFNAAGLASGVYFYTLQVRPLDFSNGPDSPGGRREFQNGAGAFRETKKLLLVR